MRGVFPIGKTVQLLLEVKIRGVSCVKATWPPVKTFHWLPAKVKVTMVGLNDLPTSGQTIHTFSSLFLYRSKTPHMFTNTECHMTRKDILFYLRIKCSRCETGFRRTQYGSQHGVCDAMRCYLAREDWYNTFLCEVR